MKQNQFVPYTIILLIASAVFYAASYASAEFQITGTLGSASATMTIDGKQIPAPPIPFGGVIKEEAKDSKSYWPPRVVPPKGAPNVLLIMTDDQGFRPSRTWASWITR